MKNLLIFLALSLLASDCNTRKEVTQNRKVEPTNAIDQCTGIVDSFLRNYWVTPPEYAVYDGYRLLSDTILVEIDKIENCIVGKNQFFVINSFGKPSYFGGGVIKYPLINPATFERKNLLFRVNKELITKIEFTKPQRID